MYKKKPSIANTRTGPTHENLREELPSTPVIPAQAGIVRCANIREILTDVTSGEYLVNEPAPTEADVQSIFAQLSALATQRPGTLAILRNYIGQWARWLKLGLSTLTEFATCVQTHLPTHLFMLDAQFRGFFRGITSLTPNLGSQTSMK